MDVLERIHDDDALQRDRLAALRAAGDYDAAWSESDPLVSVVIPTYRNTEALSGRSLPSALAQSHRNLEVIVVGDAAPIATAEAIARVGDERVRYVNLPYNGPYLEDDRRRWLASGTPPYNAGVRLARGRWIAPLGDDDEFVDDHIERLLAAAREERSEYVYGLIRQVLPDGTESELGTFPPRSHQTGVQSAVYHRGLAFIEFEPAHALFGVPNDWGLIGRMLRIGVRMRMVDAVSTVYLPSMRGTVEPADDATGAGLTAAESLARMAEALEALRGERDDARAEAEGHRDATTHWQRRFDEVASSRSWRVTALLRRLRR